MSSLIVDTMGDVAFEVMAAASLAAVASLAAIGVHCTKRQNGRAHAMTPASKKTRMKSRDKAVEHTHPVLVANNVAINMEPVILALQRRASSTKWCHKLVYTFLDDLGREMVNLSLKDVDRAARKVAAILQRDAHVKKGDRVVLCFPPGLDFALAFWGCLYAGVVGIPVYPPYPGTLSTDLPKFNRLIEDSGAAIVLTNTTYYLASKMATVKGYFSLSRTSWPAHLQWITTDNLSDSLVLQYNEQDAMSLTHHDVAFFQYSSGSTSAPKAVMITHGNLKAQLKTWESIIPSDTMVSWLPSYHDMGLVGFIITPCVFAARCVSMSPISFIKDPTLWMRTASKYMATHVCAPNFGYALVARKTSDKQAAEMDLSTLKQTICAAEPIRPDSLAAFTAKFRVSGFNPHSFNCGYGLAEVTLVCTGQDPPQLPTILSLNKHILETQRRAEVYTPSGTKPVATDVLQLVGCGKPMPTFNVSIVDADTKVVLDEQVVGEVWVQGPSVALGYWNRPEYTKEMFHAQVAGTKSMKKAHLRTGDMGFFFHGELFITGRLKDLIILRGRNVCPQDIEASVETAHENVRPGCSAAFSIEKGDEEALVVVAEIKNGTSLPIMNDICREIITRVLSEHQIKCEAIVLLRQKTIPKTTSGKIQRSASKARFLDGTLEKPLFEYRSTTGNVSITSSSASSNTVISKAATLSRELKTPDEILTWLLEHVADEMAPLPIANEKKKSNDTLNDSVRTGKTDPHTPWAMFGMDSVAIVGLSSDLSEFLGCIVSPSVFFMYDTPFKLANAPGLASGELTSVQNENDTSSHCAIPSVHSIDEIDASCFEIENFPEVQRLFQQMHEFEQEGLIVPFLETLTPEKRQMVNFNTYNYLGNASDAVVAAASKAGIDKYGTTMSSSPIVGQTQLNVDLENALCEFFHAEACILFVGGWVSNVTTIDTIVSKGDLILCDALNHDSCVSGQRLSGATILPFPHNDTKALERMLASLRTTYRRVLIVVEGVYSMDGDIPDIPELIRLKKKYKAILFLDEAHSFGTMGSTGRGICEHFDVNPHDIDIRMGTLSKALGSVGGFILGSKALVQYLKHCAGGFVFSVGLAPACGAAALASLELMTQSASRTVTLQERSGLFYDLCQEHKVPIRKSTYRGAPVVVVMIGSTIATAQASEYLASRKINVKPIVYPAVEEGKCRLRFFLSALHTPKELNETVKALTMYLSESAASKVATSAALESTVEMKRNGLKTTSDGVTIVKKRKTRKKKRSSVSNKAKV